MSVYKLSIKFYFIKNLKLYIDCGILYYTSIDESGGIRHKLVGLSSNLFEQNVINFTIDLFFVNFKIVWFSFEADDHYHML